MENITLLNSTNSSLTLAWTPPLGHVDTYEVSVSGAEPKTITVIISSVISNLTAGRVYSITVASVSGVLKNISNIVQFATSESEKLHKLHLIIRTSNKILMHLLHLQDHL